MNKEIQNEERNKLIKVRIDYQGNGQWQLRPETTKSGRAVSKGKYTFRGTDEEFRKFLVKCKVSDTDSEPAGRRNKKYADIVQDMKKNKATYVWMYSSKWNSSNKIKQEDTPMKSKRIMNERFSPDELYRMAKEKLQDLVLDGVITDDFADYERKVLMHLLAGEDIARLKDKNEEYSAMRESTTKPKDKKKPMKRKKETIFFDDNEEAIEDLAEEIENAGIEWYGIDASLSTNLGEYITYFPNSNLLVRGEEYQYLFTTFADRGDIEEWIADAIDDHGEEIASFAGSTLDQFEGEFSNARGVQELIPLLLIVDEYIGGIFENRNPSVEGGIRLIRRVLGLMNESTTKSKERESPMKHKKEQSETIEIPKDMEIPGTDYILEKGDMIEVITEGLTPEATRGRIGSRKAKGGSKMRKQENSNKNHVQEISMMDVRNRRGDKAKVVRGFLEAAIFTSEEVELETGVFEVEDFSEESFQEAIELVETFLSEASHLLTDQNLYELRMDWDNVGHDLWMTLTGQGVGFWESEWGEIGDELTEIVDSIPYHYEMAFYDSDDDELILESKKKGKGRSRKQEATQVEDTVKAIKRALRADLEVDEIEFEGGDDYEGFEMEADGRASNGESEWLVFTSSDRAEQVAIERVKQDLEMEPEIFNTDFLYQHIYITDTDRRMIAIDEGENFVEDLSIEEVWDHLDGSDELEKEYEELVQRAVDNEDEPADEERLDDIFYEAKEKLAEQISNQVYQALEDPIQYFVEDQGMFRIEELFEQPFIQIDVEQAAMEAVNIDGVSHFLDAYDGTEEEITDPKTGETFIAYGMN